MLGKTEHMVRRASTLSLKGVPYSEEGQTYYWMVSMTEQHDPGRKFRPSVRAGRMSLVTRWGPSSLQGPQ